MAEHKKPTKFSEVGAAVCVEFLGSVSECAGTGRQGQACCLARSLHPPASLLTGACPHFSKAATDAYALEHQMFVVI